MAVLLTATVHEIYERDSSFSVVVITKSAIGDKIKWKDPDLVSSLFLQKEIYMVICSLTPLWIETAYTTVHVNIKNRRKAFLDIINISTHHYMQVDN